MTRVGALVACVALAGLTSACATAIPLPRVDDSELRAVEVEIGGATSAELERQRNVRYWEITLTDDEILGRLSPGDRDQLAAIPIHEAAGKLDEQFTADKGIDVLEITRLSPSLVRNAAAQSDTSQSADLFQLADYVDRVQSVVHRRILAIGRRVADAAGRPDVTFIADSQVGLNAFAPVEFGSNRVFVGTELALSAASDDELACSIGHELAHLTEGHTTSSAWVNVGKMTLTIAAAAAFAAAAAQANDGRPLTPYQIDAAMNAGQLTAFLLADVPLRLSGWERGQEREADAVGLYYAWRAGFSPEACAQNMLRMAEDEAAQGSGGAISWWNVHPVTTERVVALRKLAAQARSGTLHYGR